MAAKKESAPESNNLPQLQFVLHSEQRDFLLRAVAQSGKTRSAWMRDSLMLAGKKELGEEPPDVEIAYGGGRRDEITIAAEQEGLTRAQYMKRAALIALKLPLPEELRTGSEPEHKAKSKRKRSKKSA